VFIAMWFTAGLRDRLGLGDGATITDIATMWGPS
jgi:hypothetical protein